MSEAFPGPDLGAGDAPADAFDDAPALSAIWRMLEETGLRRGGGTRAPVCGWFS